jgi:hypothetical protein
MTTDTGASLSNTRPDITITLLKRKPSQPYILETVSGETLLVLAELTLG